MTYFLTMPDNQVTIERASREFRVYGDTLEELGKAAAEKAMEFYGEISFRITHLAVEPNRLAPNEHDLSATAYTEST